MQVSSSSHKSDSEPIRGLYSDVQRTTRIFYWFITLITAALFVGIFIVMSTNSVFAATVIGLSILPTLASLYFVHREKFEVAAAFLALVLITSITIVATRGLGIHHISVLGYPAILIIASLVTRTRTMIVITFYNLLCAAWLVFGELSGAYTPGVLVQSVPGDFFSVATILMITAAMARFIARELFQSSAQLQNELSERQRTEEKYRAMVENSIDGIFQSTLDGRFISVNPAMARIYGYASPEEMINSITDISTQLYVDPYERERVKQLLENEEKLIGHAIQEYRKDGSTFWASLNARVVRDAGGKVLYYEGTVEDITSQREAVEKLRERQHFIETILDTEPGTVYIYDLREQRNLFINRDWLIYYGYSAEETQSAENFLATIIHTEDLPRISAHHNQLRLAGKDRDIFEIEYRVRKKDGEWCWVQSRDTVFNRNEAGEAVQILGILYDVTSHKIGDEALRDSEERYRTLFNGILEGVYRSTPEGRFVDLNPAMARMFGYDSREEMLAVDIKAALFFSPEDRKSDYLAPGEERVDTFLMKRKNGSEIWVEDHGHYVYDEQGQIIFHEGLLRDVTPHIIAERGRKKAEAEIQKLNTELNERIKELEAKNAELTQFTYTVSHDLKSPLVTISGFLGFLEQDAESRNMERLRKDAARIREAVNKMQMLLTELLELSRIGRMMNTPENIPFVDIVKDALDIVHGQIEARGAAIWVRPNLPTIRGDRQRLTEVLQNLIDNALKYMGTQPKPHIEIGQNGQEGSTLIFFVKDNGMGIAPEYHERIFGLFNKLDSASEGTGIGLALVKKIIEVHGGRIWVESEPGQGATFYFTLPVASAG